ncbi:DctP family TRAP transporter solute-binding subunit [Metabacillus herbersteinensis]|uniref:DctP family TRAP transporter solute-binding subunit n=1 Tax=Metabacillus herbersteinensis TaxID=283816 RepID=A0ABV6GBL3_9BACI
MKIFFITSITVAVIVFFTFFIAKDFMGNNKMDYDDEQVGLKDQIVIRFSHVVAENTPKGLAAQKFAELANEKTDGRVTVEVRPNGALYSDDEEMEALARNDVQMIAPSFSKMTKKSPEWALFDLPFLFKDYNDVNHVFTGVIGAEFLALHEQAGIKGLALWSNGFKQMTSNQKPLIKPEDFKGQRFRIMPSGIIEEQFKLLNAESIVVPFNEVYKSLEENKFDGQENTISNIYSKRLYERQDYMTVSNHGFLGYTVLMNKDFWNKLPSDVQTDLEDAMNETTQWILKESEQLNQGQLNEIKEKSTIKIHYLSDQEKVEWSKKLQPAYETYKSWVSPKFNKHLTNLLKESEAE